MPTFEKIFSKDILSKRERVERTLNCQSVDRAVIHEQLSYNPQVISMYTGKMIDGFNFTKEDICEVIRKTLDACFPPFAPLGKTTYVNEDGFTIQTDDWYLAIVGRPFSDVGGAREYLLRKIHMLNSNPFIAEQVRSEYHDYMKGIQNLVGDTVIIDWSINSGFCDCWSNLGLEIFTYLYDKSPGVVVDYLDAVIKHNVRKVHAVADPALSPVVLIAEDFASKTGSIFSPTYLRNLHFPYIKQLTDAWHEHGIKVLYHSDGNWKKVIPDLVACGVDGFYCLEPALGMDIVELHHAWPNHVWAGGLDGIDLMERGTPEQVRNEVHRLILETNVLKTGGIFIDTSSEINPPVKPENYKAMIDAVGEIYNADFPSVKE